MKKVDMNTIEDYPRTNVKIFNDIITDVLQRKERTVINNKLNKLAKNNGIALLACSFVNDYSIWMQAINDGCINLGSIVSLFRDKKVYVPAIVRQKALELACFFLEEHYNSQDYDRLQYASTVLTTLLENLKSYSFIDVPFLSHSLQRVAKVIPKGNVHEVKFVRTFISSYILAELDRMSIYDIYIDKILKDSYSRGALFIALRRNKNFYPILLEYLKYLYDNNRSFLVEIYPDVIEHVLFDGEFVTDYRTLVDLFLDIASFLPYPNDNEIKIVEFFMRICRTDRQCIKNIIDNIEKYKLDIIVNNLLFALFCSSLDMFWELVQKIIVSRDLQVYLPNIINSILVSFDYVYKDFLEQMFSIGDNITKHRDVFKEVILSQKYCISEKDSVKTMFLLFMVALSAGEHTLSQFVQQNIVAQEKEVSKIIKQDHVFVLIRNLLFFYFKLHKMAALGLDEIANRIKIIRTELAAIGISKDIIAKSFRKAIDSFRKDFFIMPYESYLRGDVVESFMRAWKKVANKKPKITIS